MSNFDVKVMYTEDDLKKVQMKPNLYLQKYGDLGVFHLFKEGAQNAYDEFEDKKCQEYLKSVGDKKKTIKITYDRLSDKTTIEDNGRGIPENDYTIEVVCTKLQSGSKFLRDQGGATSGEFGVGITVTNALSSYFSIATYRNDYYHMIEFENGEKINDIRENIKKGGKKHGTIISFIPNQKYLGKGAHLPIEEVKSWVNMMSYLIGTDIEVIIETWEGISHISTEKYKRRPFSEFINVFISDPKTLLVQPLSFESTSVLEEEITKTLVDEKSGKVKEKKHIMKKDVKLGFAFAYDVDLPEADYISFCNYTKTDDGGVHIDSVEEALCKYLQKRTVDGMSDAQKAKMDITKNDVKSGLKLIVNLSTNAQVQFMGNAKTKIRNEALKPLIKSMVVEELDKYFTAEPQRMQLIAKVIKENAKARIEAAKAKSVSVSKRVDNFSEYAIPNFIKCNNTGKAYKELFLIEGRKSAAGSMVNGRDAATQAIFGFRGVTANAHKKSLAEIMDNPEWRAYVKVIRTGIGKDFDINRLYYNKIIISTDADIDGYGIGVGIAGFHVRYMPEIVEGGFLYKVYPPLYHIDDPNRPFIGTKAELTEIYLQKVVKNFKIRVIAHLGSGYLNKDELWTFLYKTIDYMQILTSLYDFYKVDKGLCEVIALGLTRYGAIDTRGKEPQLIEKRLTESDFIRDFMKEVQSRYPETTFKNGTVRGVINGSSMKSIHINQRFISKITDLIPVYQEYDYKLMVKEKNCEERKMTIGEFLDLTSRLSVKILNRFKGLGEANAEDLWTTTLNPMNRSLVRLTFDNIERDMEIFNKLKSDKPVYQAQRKKMIEEYRIRREDIDN